MEVHEKGMNGPSYGWTQS